MTGETRSPYEPTAWMREKVRERLNMVRPMLRSQPPGDWAVVMLMLSEPTETATKEERDHWELSCDRCGRYCPPPTDFFTGAVTLVELGHRVTITFGMCDACHQVEHA